MKIIRTVLCYIVNNHKQTHTSSSYRSILWSAGLAVGFVCAFLHILKTRISRLRVDFCNSVLLFRGRCEFGRQDQCN